MLIKCGVLSEYIWLLENLWYDTEIVSKLAFQACILLAYYMSFWICACLSPLLFWYCLNEINNEMSVIVANFGKLSLARANCHALDCRLDTYFAYGCMTLSWFNNNSNVELHCPNRKLHGMIDLTACWLFFLCFCFSLEWRAPIQFWAVD